MKTTLKKKTYADMKKELAAECHRLAVLQWSLYTRNGGPGN